jgi:hypothetical protein
MSPLPFQIRARCVLCGTAWGEQQGWSHTIEKPVLLLCGSIYGEECMNARLDSGTNNMDDTDRRRCRHCGQQLWYAQCGHTFRPRRVAVAGKTTVSLERRSLPLVAPTAEMPEKCEECAITPLPYRKQLKFLKRNHEHFLRHHEERHLTQEQVAVVAKEHAEYDAEN